MITLAHRLDGLRRAEARRFVVRSQRRLLQRAQLLHAHVARVARHVSAQRRPPLRLRRCSLQPETRRPILTRPGVREQNTLCVSS